MDDMKPIDLENKEIRGITLKLIRGIIIGWTTLVLTIASTYFGLKYQIIESSESGNHRDELQDISIKAINSRLDRQDVDIKLLNTTITRQDIELERIKEKLNIK